MNASETANAALKVAQQAETVAQAVSIAETIALEALIAAELAISASATTLNETSNSTLLALAKKMASVVSQELLLQQQALNAISQGVVITDADRRITYANNAFKEITGYASADMMGRKFTLLQGADTNLKTLDALQTALNAGQPFHDEILNYRKNGTAFWNELSITPIRNEAGVCTQYICTYSDISVRKTSNEKIEHLAFYDHLTDLPNRRLLMDRLAHAFTSSERSGRQGAVLFIDLDKFKDVNDTLGHSVGDLLLKQLARRLESCMRKGDTIACLGGDEFVVILEALSEQRFDAAKQVSAIGEKILSVVNLPYQLDSYTFSGTCSIGAVMFFDHEQSADELLKRADIALFRSKNTGRNALTFFNQDMQDAIQKRVDIEKDIRVALDNKQFLLHFQIQVDSENKTLGAEALIRWLHPTRGLLSPAQFIQQAEEVDLILPLGQWVIEAACHQLSAWQHDAHTRELVLSVNISAKEFRQPHFVTNLQLLVQKYAINPKLLKLELTESTLLESVEKAIELMQACRLIGVTFSLDDFGTGYSSLQYLKRLPFEQLKIDQSFIRDIVTDNSDRVIVHTIIAMAKSLGIGVIAEGVETAEQRQLLLDNGCTAFQGYLFGKPMPLKQFEEILRRT